MQSTTSHHSSEQPSHDALLLRNDPSPKKLVGVEVRWWITSDLLDLEKGASAGSKTQDYGILRLLEKPYIEKRRQGLGENCATACRSDRARPGSTGL